MKRVLVTGASGFLGSHLVKKLIASGYQVIAYRRQQSNLYRLDSDINQIDWFNIEDGIELPFKKYRDIYTVIHTATNYGRKGEGVIEVLQANLIFPTQILEMAIKYKVKLFINTDTVLDKYTNSYSLSKSQFREWLKQQNNIKIINFKLEHIYGPLDDDSKFITYIAKKCLSNTQELALTKGEQKRDFVYIDDVLEAYMIVLNVEYLLTSFEEFTIGMGTSVPIKEIVSLIKSMSRSKINLQFGKIPYRTHELMDSKTDISKIKSLGWSPKYSLYDGIKKVIKSLEEF